MKIGTTQNLLDHVKDTIDYILGHLLAFENALRRMMRWLQWIMKLNLYRTRSSFEKLASISSRQTKSLEGLFGCLQDKIEDVYSAYSTKKSCLVATNEFVRDQYALTSLSWNLHYSNQLLYFGLEYWCLLFILQLIT